MASIKKAIQWAISIANNNKYLYKLGGGHGVQFEKYNGVYFDCSSFLSFALYHGGFYKGTDTSFSTSDEYNALTKLGFTVKNFSEVGKDNLKSGMIIFYSDSPYGHTAMMINNNELVEASTDNAPKNEQIRVANYYNANWEYVAYTDDTDFDIGIWDSKSIYALLGNMWFESTMNPQIEENLGQGGVVGLGVGLIQWSNAGSYQANWNAIIEKANAYGFNSNNPKQISTQCKAIEYELLDGTIKTSGGYYPSSNFHLTGKEFVYNSKNKSIEYLVKAYSYGRGEFAPRINNWQGVTKAKELSKILPNFNKTIDDIGYDKYIVEDEILGKFYGTNIYLPNDDCKLYNCKLIYDYLSSGSDRPIIYNKKKRNGMIFVYPKKR